jgi:hypothetical protein
MSGKVDDPQRTAFGLGRRRSAYKLPKRKTEMKKEKESSCSLGA